MANAYEAVKINDKVNVKVKRFNSLSSRIERAIRGIKRPFYRNTERVDEGFRLDGYVTANVRRWNEETKSYSDWDCITYKKHNLVTNAGKDFFFQQSYKDTGLSTNGTYYVGVSATVFTPAVGDTTLNTELAANGFSRAAGTYAHTTGQSTATVTITYTATATQNNVQAGALFSAVSAGTMSHEFTFTSTSFLTNDQLQLIVTITYT